MRLPRAVHFATSVALSLLTSGVVVATAPRPAAAAVPPAPVAYRPPVDAELVDTFRPPSTPYGAGNRGIDYATAPGDPVVAAAAGEVVFAGRVGTAMHVVLRHADGIRTSYSFLDRVTVRRGDRVEEGQLVGYAGAQGVHFGARAGDAYLDPLVLLGQRVGRVRLVVDDDPSPAPEAAERDELLGLLRLAGPGPGAIDGRGPDGAGAWLRARAAGGGPEDDRRAELDRILADDVGDLTTPMAVYLARAEARWTVDQEGCTPAGTAAPRADRRRIVVLVGGLGSATGAAAVLRVDTAALGYRPADVHQFSYRADGSPYGPAESEGDLSEAGSILAARIRELQATHPDAVVDVIAHSQGGLVARSAVTTHGAAPAVVVTLGTPHQGADLATAGAGLGATASGRLLLDRLSQWPGIRPNGTSVAQMAETSRFLGDLPEQGWAPTTSVLSVAARHDLVVPSHQSRLPAGVGASVVVSLEGSHLADHDDLPGSPQATTEIARALAGQRPTCRSLADALADESISREIAYAEDALGALLALGGVSLDARARAEVTLPAAGPAAEGP